MDDTTLRDSLTRRIDIHKDRYRKELLTLIANAKKELDRLDRIPGSEFTPYPSVEYSASNVIQEANQLKAVLMVEI